MVTRQAGPIPVTVIGGFLGAGKTTLVNHILGGDHELKIAVMVNDFGAINIDAALITSTEGGLYSLSNGCVCCGMNQGLVEQLEELLSARIDIDHIVIEASGVADPARIMDTVRYARFAGRLRGDAIVVLVDAAGFDGAIAAAPGLAEAQVGSADLLILNKTDLVSRDILDAWHARWAFPDTRTIETTNARVPFDLLFAGGFPSRGASSPFAAVPVHEQAESVTWRHDGPIDAKRLHGVLAALPARIYRAKGFVQASDGRLFAVHVVGARVSFEPASHLPEGFDGQSLLVLVGFGRDLPFEGVLAQLNGCGALARSGKKGSA
ncbi:MULTISPECIES: CobW family GTP-binding protein [unclassified Shinella]|uniref:CobW family GTP-binding protein n=1 Tax=unclassified Shinella TaxID=2643062 RepID=UPI00225D1203|nr:MULTISPECIES: CobW family GTP-binding protein [unclassified Shinella]MCO5138873.1 GTP-binding protein [Shinella sp.]MDC7255711.1 GTP-binding protein [Shinella sp. YE25]CAI0338522.1 G3E family GTPase [Rhizobiaceae bacterium]CAK7256966.1 G3E family GTPase [Shinella sp. WSC3-e]